MVLWTPQHAKTLIPAIIVMLILALVLRKCLLQKDWHKRMIPVQIIAALLILLELGKQIYSFRVGYDLYHIPLHLSFPIQCRAFHVIFPENSHLKLHSIFISSSICRISHHLAISLVGPDQRISDISLNAFSRR